MGGTFVAGIRRELRAHADPARAPGMQAYMKSALPYLGVPVPAVRALTRAAERADPSPDRATLTGRVDELWTGADYREERYAATALLDAPAARRLRSPALLPLLERLIVEGAWWDHVDELSRRVGELLTGWPDEVRARIVQWTQQPDLWLRRASVICQLGHGPATDVDLLTVAVDAAAAEREFFLRKAIGWALRDYARTEPEWVRAFVAARDLSPLSRREALKHL